MLRVTVCDTLSLVTKRDMKKFLLRFSRFLYKRSGLERAVGLVDLMVTNYRLRLNATPKTYRLFLIILGVTLALGWNRAFTEYQALTEPLVMENPTIIQTAKAESVPEVIEKPWSDGLFTAYTASVDETDSSPLVMASNKMVYLGAIACPKEYKFGTKIEIRGMGVYTCEDRGGAIVGNHFDIFVLTKAEAFKFGKRNIEFRVN